MPRSKKKIAHIHFSILKKLKQKVNPIKTYSRNSSIIPDLVGTTLLIHNGKSFQKVLVTEHMIGHKIGEFALTRKLTKHSIEKRK
jgi:small subunit ribosomal protein S19